MTNYTAVVNGVDGIRKSDEIVLMQASTITPVVFDFIQADATPYIFEAGDVVSGTFVDDVTLEEFSISGTITPATGGNTASWARAVADVGTPAEYRLYMMVTRGGAFDYTEPSPMTVLSVPGVGIVPPSPLVGVSIAEAAWLAVALDTVPDAGDLITSADVADKADKDTDATIGNLAEFDAGGNPVDSGNAAGDFEPSLGNPAVDGYTLSSTIAGVRSWIASAAGAAWGGITGTLADQTDLQNALDGKETAGSAAAAIDTIRALPFSTQLAEDVSSGTTIETTSTLNAGMIGSYISLVTFDENTEVRRITGISGSTVTVESAIANPHSEDDYIVVLDGKSAQATLWGVYSGLATATANVRIQAAIDEVANKIALFFGFGTYTMNDIDLPSGTSIICADGATMKAANTSSNIFTTTGSINRIRVSGGIWRDADVIWEHSGSAAASVCVWHDMIVRNVNRPFDITASVANVWERIEFGPNTGTGNVDSAFYFRMTGSGGTNFNEIRGCGFNDHANQCIYVASGSYIAIGNIINGNRFERNSSGAIRIGSRVLGTKIIGNYFENNGADGVADVVMDGGTVSNINCIGSVISENTFATANAAQSARIENLGHSGYRAVDNFVYLKTGQTFAYINGHTFSIEPEIRLENNYLNSTDGGTYAVNLFLRAGSNQQPVSWSNFVYSANVTEADKKVIYADGRDTRVIISSATNDTTPSIRNADFVQLSAAGPITITDFDDGLLSQKIIAKNNTAHSITVQNNANIVTGTGADVVLTTGQTITLVMFEDQVWTQV